MATGWLEILTWTGIALGLVSAFVVAIDVARRPQQMWIMNIVWPVTALYSGVLGVGAYLVAGRRSTRIAVREAKRRGLEPPARRAPFWQAVAIGATHCGAGCSLGDLVVESFLIAVPVSIFGSRIAAAWSFDYMLAFLFGILFQYFTIVPMRHSSVGKGIRAAIKADALSLTSWQIGMYGWMAVMIFGVFGREIPRTTPVFWFLMQIAMVCGFVTAYPVNWWLIRAGLKERM